MKGQGFSLKPFPSNKPLLDVAITGTLQRRSDKLSVSYALSGPVAEIAIPVLADRPVRRNALWEETCFEFFLAPKSAGHYWEFNLSPAGHWNVYRFTSYRQGMKEEAAFTSLPFGVQHDDDCLRLFLEIDLEMIIPAEEALEVAISAVVKARNGTTTHWALIHTRPQADFHRRDSFIIGL